MNYLWIVNKEKVMAFISFIRFLTHIFLSIILISAYGLKGAALALAITCLITIFYQQWEIYKDFKKINQLI